ncbi:MAG: hypothetical protein WDM92_16730 [Caulobacteraceae bacterium]
MQRVIWPVLQGLQPRGVALSVEPVDEEFFFKTAEDVTHNALGQEARKAFAMILGATFERQLRHWLAQSAPGRAEEIQEAKRPQLQRLVEEIKGRRYDGPEGVT